MIPALLHPLAILAQLRRTLAMMLGRGTADTLFSTNSAGLWQALIVNWILVAFLELFKFQELFPELKEMFPEAYPGMTHNWSSYGLSVLLSIVSSLLYVMLVLNILQRLGREAAFLRFMVPYLWLHIMNGVVSAGVLVGAWAAGVSFLYIIQIFYLPLVVWFVFWLYWLARVAKNEIGLGILAGIGFLFLQLLVHVMLILLSGLGSSPPA